MIVVTGASGQLGSHLCKELDRLNVQYLRISRDKNLSLKYSSKNHYADLSIPNLDWMHIGRNVSSIVHLAAAVPHSPEYPDDLSSSKKTEIMDQNIINLQSVTKAPLIYISTCGLYSKSSSRFHQEEDLKSLYPSSPYFLAKYKGEQEISRIENATILRLSAPVSNAPKTGLVLEKMIRDGRLHGHISVYGSGTREQDFISVFDTTSAILKVLDKQIFGVYNLCSSNPVTMKRLADVLSTLLGLDAVKLGDKQDPYNGEKARYCNSNLKNVIDWEPVTDIVEIIQTLEILK